MSYIDKTVEFVKETLAQAEGGHDWWHIYRVWRSAKRIAAEEEVDLLIVELAALLHDIADSKFHDGDEEIGPRIAGEFLQGLNLPPEKIHHVQQIIRHMSFKNEFDKPSFSSQEMKVVQDADRLDAMGAIGIARAFNYGGHKQRALYDPNIKPERYISKEAYKKTSSPTINHFYEKLLLLKDLMKTKTGQHLAEARHQYMEQFLDTFYAEWEGNQ